MGGSFHTGWIVLLAALAGGCDGGVSSSTVRTLDRPPVCTLSAPVAVPCGGPKTRIAFDATASVDPDDPNALLAFRWTSSCSQANWFLPAPGLAILEVNGCNSVCEIELTVTSGQLSTRCQATVAILSPASAPPVQPFRDNGAPFCDAGPAQIVECSQLIEVSLDGSGSRDPEGEPLSFSWTTDLVGASFDDPTDPTPTLRIPTGTGCDRLVTATLEVSDGRMRSRCTTTVTVLAPNDAPNDTGRGGTGRGKSASAQRSFGPEPGSFEFGLQRADLVPVAGGAPLVLWRATLDAETASRLVSNRLHLVACEETFATVGALVGSDASQADLGFPWFAFEAPPTPEVTLYLWFDRETSARLSRCEEASVLCGDASCAHRPSTSPTDKRSTSSSSSR